MSHLDLELLVEEYCKTNEIKRFGPEARTSCYCCNKGWDSTFSNIKYKEIPFDCVICPNCKKKANKKRKIYKISTGMAIKYMHDGAYKKNNTKTKIIDIPESEVGTLALTTQRINIKYGINRHSNPWR